MTAVHEFLFSRLTSDAAVAAVIQRNAFYVKMPDNPPMPAITYQILSGSHVESFSGDSNLRSPIVGIDSWARTAKAASELSELARKSLHGYKGTFGSLVIQNILEWSENDVYDSETQIFHVAASCRVWYYNNS